MFGVALIVTVVGFILALAIHPSHPGSVNVNTVGWILVVAGLIAFIADLTLWSSWGPGYLRRRRYITETPVSVAPGYRAGWPRRRVIEEEELPPRGPGL